MSFPIFAEGWFLGEKEQWCVLSGVCSLGKAVGMGMAGALWVPPGQSLGVLCERIERVLGGSQGW